MRFSDDMMRGPVGSEIIITVVREGVTEPFDVSIIRDTIKLQAVKGRVVGKAVVLRIMPPGNLTQMTDAERETIARWFDAK